MCVCVFVRTACIVAMLLWRTAFFLLLHLIFVSSRSVSDLQTDAIIKYQTIFTYIIIYMFIIVSTDFMYADPLGRNWLMAGTFVDGFITMRTKIVTCKLIFLIDWISKCSAAYGRCKNDELQHPSNERKRGRQKNMRNQKHICMYLVVYCIRMRHQNEIYKMNQKYLISLFR